MIACVQQPSKLWVALWLSLSLTASAYGAEIVSWDVLENGLCEVALDRDGDGVADTSELHVVEWSGRSVLQEAELLAVASLDRVWLFIVEEDDGQFVYIVQIAPLVISEVRDHGKESGL